MSRIVNMLLSNTSKIVLERCSAVTNQPAPKPPSKLQSLRMYRIPKLPRQPTTGEPPASESQCRLISEEGTGSATENTGRVERETSSPSKLSFEDAINASSAVMNSSIVGSDLIRRSNDGTKQKDQEFNEEPGPSKIRKHRKSDSAAIVKAKQSSRSRECHRTGNRRQSVDSLVESAKQSDAGERKSAKGKRRRSLQRESVDISTIQAECGSKKKQLKSSKKKKGETALLEETGRDNDEESSSKDAQYRDRPKQFEELKPKDPGESKTNRPSKQHKKQFDKTEKPKRSKKKESEKARNLTLSLTEAVPCSPPTGESRSAPITDIQPNVCHEEPSTVPCASESPERISVEVGGATEEVSQEPPGNTMNLAASDEEHCNDSTPPAEVQRENPDDDSAPMSTPPEEYAPENESNGTEPQKERIAERPEVPTEICEERRTEVEFRIDNPAESFTSTEATIPEGLDSFAEYLSLLESIHTAAEEIPVTVKTTSRPSMTEEECRHTIAKIAQELKEAERTLAGQRAAVQCLNKSIHDIEDELMARRDTMAAALAQEEEAATVLRQYQQRFDQIYESLADRQKAEMSQMLELRSRQVAHLELVIKGRQNRDIRDPVLDQMIAAADRAVKDAEDQLKPILADINLLQSRVHAVEKEMNEARVRKNSISAKLEVSYYSVRAALDEQIKSKTGERQRLEDEVARLENLLSNLRRQRTDAKINLEEVLHRKRLEKIKAQEDDDDDENENGRRDSRDTPVKLTLASFARAPQMDEPDRSAVDMSRGYLHTAGGVALSSTIAEAAAAPMPGTQSGYLPPSNFVSWISLQANQQAFGTPSKEHQQLQQQLLFGYAAQHQQQLHQQAWSCCFYCAANCAVRCQYCALPFCYNRCMVLHRRQCHPTLP